MSSISDRQKDVNDKLNAAFERLLVLEDEQKKIQGQFDKLNADRNRFAILSDIADHLEKLENLGGSRLFWGDDLSPEGEKKFIGRINSSLATFDEKIRKLTTRRNQIQEEVDELTVGINQLNEQTLILEEVAEEAKHEFVIEREMGDVEYRPLSMPWHREGEDDKRYRRILLITLFIAILLGYLIPLWDVPIPERVEIEVPERLAKLMLKKEPPPPPPEEKKVEPEPEELKKKAKTKKPKPDKKKVKVARKRAESAGLLAFKDNFSDLMSSDVDKKLASAQISASGKTAKTATRNIITSQAASGTSGGINTASLSRDVGGAGKGIKGVGFSRVETSIGSDFFGEERPLSDGVSPSRTDEEIQIVFDRYKAALYRIYNRELRKNPTLQGKMVLRITIDPKGIVTKCRVESSDMDSPALDSKIVDRVKKFNFGPKDGVPTITILYPIDFLPAS